MKILLFLTSRRMKPIQVHPKAECFVMFHNKPSADQKCSAGDTYISQIYLLVTKKILAMTNMLQLTDNDLHERSHIVYEITKVLRPYYPDCVVKMFGSSVNGFGCKGCDLDLLFLPFPEYCNLDFMDCEDSFTPSPFRVMNGDYPIGRLYKMNDKTHLRFVMRIMYTEKWFFNRIIFIPAKCPILNIQFASCDIKCDFSCSNRLVLCNTELLSLFGNLDFRVKPLVITLRYWAKSLGLIKKSLLSSYAFTIMVIFALQNTDPPVLPSVKMLSELAGFSFKIDDWETAIALNLNIIPRSSNTASVEELLIHFFDFYWNFDFVQNIVSPYFGRPLPVKELFESSNERIRNFQINCFSIQDPFVLSRNVSRNKAMKTSFKLALLIAKELILKRDFSLQEFLNVDFYQEKMNSVYAPVHRCLGDVIMCSSLFLSYGISLKLGITDQLQPWYDKVSLITYEVLQYGLFMECEIVDKIIWPKESSDWPPRKKRKTVSGNNILCSQGNLELISSIQCAAFFQTWSFRKKVVIPEDIKIDVDLCDTLKKEYMISKLLISEPCEITEPPIAWFMCSIYKYTTVQISDIVFLFTPLTKDSIFDSLSSFLKSYVVKTVEKVLGEN